MAHDSAACDRLFYSLPDNSKCESNSETEGGRKENEFLNYISQNIIGCDKVFSGPFGLCKGTCHVSSRCLNKIQC